MPLKETLRSFLKQHSLTQFLRLPGLSPGPAAKGNGSVKIIGQTNVDTNAGDSARTNDLEKSRKSNIQ